MNESPSIWLAAYTEPRKEFHVRDALRETGVEEVFLPALGMGKRSHGRSAGREAAKGPGERLLFTRYVFYRIAAPRAGDSWDALREMIGKIEGVQNLVGARDSRPSVVEEGEINLLRSLCSGESRPDLVPLPQRGRKVRIQTGPFAGASGVVVRSNANTTILAFTLPILAGAYEVVVPTSDLTLLGESSGHEKRKTRHRAGRRVKRSGGMQDTPDGPKDEYEVTDSPERARGEE